VYCSVDEDQRPVDFVVEAEYLADETRKLIETKGIDGVEILINSQGEPTLYHDMATLVKCMRAIPQVKDISLITNGTLLTHERVDALLVAGLSRVNLSINASTQESARKIADAGYSLKQVHELATYLSDKVELVIAPVWVPGWNDTEMSSIVGFVKSLKNNKFSPRCCIQNFLPYKLGRNPTKSMAWEKFYEKLAELEKEHEIKLTVDASDFPETLTKVGELPKPFKKDEVIDAEVLGLGRLEGEVLAIAKNRTISLIKYKGSLKGSVRVKITHTKHNIFAGVVV
ncbi:MAG: radical SAM protein, partial [Candidatus Woesearchaeota archaeon]|nr:radical SAM protein [Candidatus Woesearchaeota archaeon]